MSTRPPCTFFLRNACSYGDACRNSHIRPDSVPSKSQASSDSPACAFFMLGRCRFGDQCREFHPPSNQPESAPHPLVKPFCRYFERGSCIKGNKCPYSHDQGDAIQVAIAESPMKCEAMNPTKTQDTTPIFSPRWSFLNAGDDPKHPISDDLGPETQYPSTDRVLYHCNVQFGSGAAVLQVVTPLESRRILISNIPTSATDSDISNAISRFVTSAELQIHRSPLTALATGTLVFKDPNSAARAVSKIDEISIGAYRLSAQLDLRPSTAAEEGQGILRGRKVKLTWHGRRASAFVHYPTLQSAEENSQRLNGKSYLGNTLSASFRRPASIPTRVLSTRGRFSRFRPPAQLYTVMVHNLPVDTSEMHLKGFCRAQNVTLNLSRCPEDSPTHMHHTLERFGPVDAFDALPATKTTSKTVAFAQFQTAAAAAAAESSLRAAPPSFLDGTPFFIERTFSVKYSVRRKLFTKLQGALDLLANLHPSTIRHYLGENPNSPVVLVLHGSDPKVLGQLKTEVDRIVQGEPLVVDGQKFWDEFFERGEGQAFMDTLNASESLFVQSDYRTRTIRLFGSEQERMQARKLTLEKLAEVRARRHVFPLRKDSIRVLLRGQLREMQDRFGADTLAIDVVARTLTVNGDDGDVRRVRAALASLESGETLSAAASSDVICPVCFCGIEDPVNLDCSHSYCRDCLQHYLRPSTQDPSFSSRKCVAEVCVPGGKEKNTTTMCGIDIGYNIIRSLLTSAEEDSLLRASFLAHINEHPLDFRYCPSPDCEMVYRPGGTGSSFECPSCLIQICAACNVEFHEGMSCDEYQDNLSGGLAALAKWREKNGVKQCPNCHADIEKNGGCNHMTCALCKTHICWICMKTFSDKDNDGGIYPHLNREHGGFQ
ncbi:hypothetical protein B0H11DRAFT_1855963 [Mycena galericulata]|nr:hypothetical protein B0H11DRAFT_1855963 [Mycena galericulata]